MTFTASVRISVNPVAEALTVVLPALTGWNATPPEVTVVGELNVPGASVTVRESAAPAVVTRSAIAPLLCVTLTESPGPPARTAWSAQKDVPPGNTTPVRT